MSIVLNLLFDCCWCWYPNYTETPAPVKEPNREESMLNQMQWTEVDIFYLACLKNQIRTSVAFCTLTDFAQLIRKCSVLRSTFTASVKCFLCLFPSRPRSAKVRDNNDDDFRPAAAAPTTTVATGGTRDCRFSLTYWFFASDSVFTVVHLNVSVGDILHTSRLCFC